MILSKFFYSIKFHKIGLLDTFNKKGLTLHSARSSQNAYLIYNTNGKTRFT
jgi:hypothetical protein